jgi:hypothetical protein
MLVKMQTSGQFLLAIFRKEKFPHYRCLDFFCASEYGGLPGGLLLL